MRLLKLNLYLLFLNVSSITKIVKAPSHYSTQSLYLAMEGTSQSLSIANISFYATVRLTEWFCNDKIDLMPQKQ